jgi:hypothetical protein
VPTIASGARQLLPCRNSGELTHDEFEIALNGNQLNPQQRHRFQEQPHTTVFGRKWNQLGSAAQFGVTLSLRNFST